MTRAMRTQLDQRGFSLAEILVATMIIVVGLVGLASVIPTATYGVSEGNSVSTATFLAQQKLEEIRNAVWTFVGNTDCIGLSVPAASPPSSTTCARLQPTVCSIDTACSTYPNETPVTGYPGYNRSVTVTSCAPAGCAGVVNAGMRRVAVTVTYMPISATGASAVTARSVTLEMLVAQRQ